MRDVREMALAVDPIIWGNPFDGQRVDYYRLSEVVGLYGWDAAQRNYPEVLRFLTKLAEVAA